MDPELRARFNSIWSEKLAQRVRRDVERRLHCKIPFRLAETPLLLSKPMVERFEAAGREIVEIISQPQFIERMEPFVPAYVSGPGRGHLPQFAVVDFAVVEEEDGTLAPRLVELQGFPSLYGFQIMLADVWATSIARQKDMPDLWRIFWSGINRNRALALIDKALLHGHEPEEVVLLDLDVHFQKTYPDFAAIHHWFGIDHVAPRDLIREGNKLYRSVGGELVRVRRIFQRIVLDELEKKKTDLPFRWDEEMDVEWAPHPAWYYLWSKSSLLFIDHPTVPKTTLLSDLDAIPEDLSGYVLKPLYSFAGSGVNVEPTHADIEAVPEKERSEWVLQEFVKYAPALKTPQGDSVKAEIRMMFVRPDEDQNMTLLHNLVRFSRGKMIGVDHNKDLPFTGASVAIWPL
ncbi:MAG: hypothetical protein ACYTGZ_21455 [Planctomycetota bacterium]|jgi:hypothetical protein